MFNLSQGQSEYKAGEYTCGKMVAFHIMLNHIRYKKQRAYTKSHEIIVKFLPIPLAVMVANIVLRVKPVEAEFAQMECNADAMITRSTMYTVNGVPIEPLKMASILSDTFEEFGLNINIADLRHVLEAFSHRFPEPDTAWNAMYAVQANHSIGTSARYGRDENCFVGIPADICQANCDACNNWNTVVLHSPSILSTASHTKIYQQLQELDLIRCDFHLEQSDKTTKNVIECQLDPFTMQSPSESADQIEGNHIADLKSQECDVSPQALRAGNCNDKQCDKSPPERHFDSQETEETIFPDQPKGDTSPQTQRMKHPRTDEEIHQNKLEAQKRLRATDFRMQMQTQALQFLGTCTTSAFVIMPTGSGKTSLIWSHRDDDRCTVIFAPYKLLVTQLESICQEKGKTVGWPLHAFSGSIEALLSTAKFAVFPYEAAPEVQGFIRSLYARGRLGAIWIDEAHTLGSKGRFRIRFDDFWNLGANLSSQGVAHRFIGLTATLRQEDVHDVMKRMGVNRIGLFRKSCYRCDACKSFMFIQMRTRFTRNDTGKACNGNSKL
jgi:hypothetical protein